MWRCSQQLSQEASGQISGVLFLTFLQYLHSSAGTTGNYPILAVKTIFLAKSSWV